MSNIDMYKVIGRCLNGVKVLKYVLMNTSTNSINIVSKEQMEHLVINKRVVNCIGQYYCGKIIIKGIDCKLNQLPNYTLDGKLIDKKSSDKAKLEPNLYIKSRMVKGRKTIGYVVGLVGQDIEYKVEKNKVIHLARQGKVYNARVQKLNDKSLLRGVNCELSHLPVIQV